MEVAVQGKGHPIGARGGVLGFLNGLKDHLEGGEAGSGRIRYLFIVKSKVGVDFGWGGGIRAPGPDTSPKLFDDLGLGRGVGGGVIGDVFTERDERCFGSGESDTD